MIPANADKILQNQFPLIAILRLFSNGSFYGVLTIRGVYFLNTKLEFLDIDDKE